ncbi:MAG TPA: sigma 54-interacting transcriptional regulator [Myxococcaceae bacterium]|jgi:DNA-binding NtrC family response regulator
MTPSAIRIVRPGHGDCVVALLTERGYQIGRAETVELTFGDETVSRVHGFLHFDAVQGVWVYRDGGSTFGSALSDGGGAPGQPIPPRQAVVVSAGQAIVLGTGGSRLEFLDGVPSGAPGVGAAEWISPAARALEERVHDAARHARPVVLVGPPGSGKRHTANRIHQRSGRRGRFVTLSCTNLPTDETELWSELLGHLKDAFAGAIEARPGQLALADGGTLYLDEVDSLDWDAQSFLLRALDGADELAPLGAPPASGQPRPDIRLIAASRQEMIAGPLRPELLQRLESGDRIRVPGLDERREDVPGIARRFLEELAAEQQVGCDLDGGAVAFLSDQPWPGHVRELRTTVRATAVRCWWRDHAAAAAAPARRRPVIGSQDLRSYLVDRTQVSGAPLSVSPPTPGPATPSHARRPHHKRLSDLTREDLETALRQAAGNQARAAAALGVSSAGLRRRMEELGL